MKIIQKVIISIAVIIAVTFAAIKFDNVEILWWYLLLMLVL